MTDEKLEQIKQFFDKYGTLDEFINQYINVYNPQNAEALIQLFNDTKSNSDTWELAKFQRSTETLRLDKNTNGNITIKDIIEKAKKYDLSRYKRIMIKLDNKNYDDLDDLSTLGLDIYIKVTGDKGICTLEEFKKMRDFFNNFIDSYSTHNLSNLEKITLAYDYVKLLTYKEQTGDRLTDSRSIAKSINTGSLVCEGYSRIFCQLLSEMGIHSNLVFTKPNNKEKNGHVRVIIKVNDEKYGISDIFAFDPTWDANQNMFFISHPDETTGYEIESWLMQGDRVIEKMPPDIRYLFFMVPLHEYSKYFWEEQIEKIEKYPSGESIQLTNELIKVLEYNNGDTKDNFIFDFISDLLYKIKKVEGYSEEQTKKIIHHVNEILKQDRYGRFEKNKTQKSKAK